MADPQLPSLAAYLKIDGSTTGATSQIQVFTEGVSCPVGTNGLRLGLNAGASITTGARNMLFGEDAGRSLTTANNSVAIGFQALYSEDTVSDHVAIGTGALYKQDGGSACVAIGAYALYDSVNSIGTVAIGSRANYKAGHYNIALGGDALYNNTGGYNVAIGHQALRSATTGNYNVAIGRHASFSLTGGIRNTTIGYQAAYANLTNDFIAIGAQALKNANAQKNLGIGSQVGIALTSGESNTFIGASGCAATIATGSGNLILGDSADGIAAGNGQIALGNGAVCTASNQLAIGGPTYFVDSVFIGKGRSNASPNAVTLEPTAASGTDVAGATLTINGGRSTGDEAGGALSLGVSEAGGAGSTENTATEYMKLDPDAQNITVSKEISFTPGTNKDVFLMGMTMAWMGGL